MNEIKPIYGIDHVREWTEMNPPQIEGQTPEGFPKYMEKIFREGDLPYYYWSRVATGMIFNIIKPLRQREGEVRIIDLSAKLPAI